MQVAEVTVYEKPKVKGKTQSQRHEARRTMIEGMAVRKRAEVSVRLRGVTSLGFICQLIFWECINREFSSCIRAITYCFPRLCSFSSPVRFSLLFLARLCFDHSSHTPATTLFQYTTMWRFSWISMASMEKAPGIYGSLFSMLQMQYESHVSRFMRILPCIRSLDQHLMCTK